MKLIPVVLVALIALSTEAKHGFDVLVTPNGNIVSAKDKKSAVLLQENDSNDYSSNNGFYVGPRVQARYSLEEAIQVAIGRVKAKGKPMNVANVEIEMQRMQDACDVYFKYIVGYTRKKDRVEMREIQNMIAAELVAKCKCTVKEALAQSEPRARYYSDKKQFVKAFVDFRFKEWSSGPGDPEFDGQGVRFRNHDVGLSNRAKKGFAAEAEELWQVDGGKEAEPSKKSSASNVYKPKNVKERKPIPKR